METLELFFIYLIFLLFPNIVTSQENCIQQAYCNRNNGPLIQFPFNFLQGGHPFSCGYPGFNIACDRNSRTIVNLEGSIPNGEFFVRRIDYVAQEIFLYDEDDCLPRRLLSLNLSNTPFSGMYNRNYTFLNCSGDIDVTRIAYISCLSSTNYMVLATSSKSLVDVKLDQCKIIKTVSVPIAWPIAEYEFSTLDNDLQLNWTKPNCGKCVARGGECGFKSDSNHEIKCFNIPRRGISKGVKYIILIGVIIPSSMCAVVIGCYICSRIKLRRNGGRHSHAESSMIAPQPTIVIVGLDEPTIESYPKTVLGESRRLPKADDNTCPICLSEYRPKETLRTIPDCKHCFHTDCIDEWLRINATCPLCRNSPLPQIHFT
ncbi:hypothetical protein GIB67_042251 [Kingdonia uniflora]|uniref:RING-type E3 ubiquitin transferase n=1 Tax=Kingdonia uniflora TaxID=39325 RepID=A0A7J7LE30_9MAGN|nr:hypothetical protein GIB67_042251 [Kingdonia uniflora]